MSARPTNVKQGLSIGQDSGKALRMGKETQIPSREERLAAKLRENLHRRKAQARALEPGDKPALPKTPPKS